jgi:hypothetical protein
MSDLSMWEALAHGAIGRHGRDWRRLRRAITEFEGLSPSSAETRAGVARVLELLRARLAELPMPESERGK